MRLITEEQKLIYDNFLEFLNEKKIKYRTKKNFKVYIDPYIIIDPIESTYFISGNIKKENMKSLEKNCTSILKEFKKEKQLVYKTKIGDKKIRIIVNNPMSLKKDGYLCVFDELCKQVTKNYEKDGYVYFHILIEIKDSIYGIFLLDKVKIGNVTKLIFKYNGIK